MGLLRIYQSRSRTNKKSPATTLGPNAAFFHADVASYDSQAQAFLAVYQKWSRIDALLANAGIVDRSSLYILRHRAARAEEIPPAPDTSCTDVDYKGFLYGTQLATHFMRHNTPRRGGKIVGTASAAGVRPHPSYPEYNGAKAAVINFVRGVAGVLRAKEDIRINVVCPGIVATSIIPPEMVAAVEPAYMTSVQTVVGAYDAFLDDGDERFGVAVEATVDKVVELEEWPLGNGTASVRSVTVWEPLFNMLHGENSGMAGAIQ